MVGTGRCVLLVSVIIASLVGVCSGGETDSGIRSDAPSSPLTPPSDPSEAIVLIGTGSKGNWRRGQGSAIGDGSLIVTAYHVVFESSEIGRHTTSLLPLVVSPYLGDVCYGRIVAADRELDLAILQVPWLGHPAFPLLDDPATHQLDHVAIYSLRVEYSRAARSGTVSTRVPPAEIRTERRPIRFVVCRRGIPVEIRLTGLGRLGKGWSGAPMLAEPGNVWAGCFAGIGYDAIAFNISLLPDKDSFSPRRQEVGFGPAAGWVRKLVGDTENTDRLRVHGTRLSRPADANQATERFLKGVGFFGLATTGPEERARELDEFLLLRPASSCAMGLKAAYLAFAKQAGAEELFHQAVRQDPSNLCAVVWLGEFLEARHQVGEAREQYERARHLEPQSSYVSVALARVIGMNEREDSAQEKINALIAEFPDNGFLLAARAQVYARQKKTQEAIETLQDVVRLAPEDPRGRELLAGELKRLGKLDEAETQLRDIIALYPSNPEAYLHLARFLAECRPEAREKAVETAQQALRLASQQGSDTTGIQNFLRELESR
jgi:tetratricopeptide (TPR) repeat protein